MNRKRVEVELFEEHSVVNFYTIKYNGCDSETDKFFEKFDNDKYEEDIQTIISWIDIIGRDGAHERHFRPEGKMRDSLCAIPTEHCRLRLFALRLSDQIVILGNGDVKTTKNYKDDLLLNCYAETLQFIDFLLKKSINSGQTFIHNKDIFENNIFYLKQDCINEEKQVIRKKKI